MTSWLGRLGSYLGWSGCDLICSDVNLTGQDTNLTNPDVNLTDLDMNVTDLDVNLISHYGILTDRNGNLNSRSELFKLKRVNVVKKSKCLVEISSKRLVV